MDGVLSMHEAANRYYCNSFDIGARRLSPSGRRPQPLAQTPGPCAAHAHPRRHYASPASRAKHPRGSLPTMRHRRVASPSEAPEQRSDVVERDDHCKVDIAGVTSQRNVMPQRNGSDEDEIGLGFVLNQTRKLTRVLRRDRHRHRRTSRKRRCTSAAASRARSCPSMSRSA